MITHGRPNFLMKIFTAASRTYLSKPLEKLFQFVLNGLRDPLLEISCYIKCLKPDLLIMDRYLKTRIVECAYVL